MPQVGFEPTIPVFGRAKTVHALDRAATVTGMFMLFRELLIPSLGKLKIIVVTTGILSKRYE
jgi:hypothetical protein